MSRSSVRTLAGLLLAISVGTPACGPPSDAPPPSEVASLGVPTGATTLLPPLAQAALDFDLGGALYLGLNYAEWREGALAYVPGHPLGLARSWEIDGRRLTYRLETGRRWSDGRPVRAADVAFTFELLADTTLALPLSSVAGRIDSIGTPDDSTVVFHFDARYPGMLFDTGVGILPAHVFAGAPRPAMSGGMPLLDRLGPEGLPVSGPFALAEWRPGERIVLVRNPAASRPASLARLAVRVIPDETARAAELRAGSLDAAQINSFRVLRSLAEDGFTTLGVPQRGYDYIAWNPLAHPAFRDRAVRRALSLAIDRRSLIDALDMSGFAEPAWGPYGSLFEALRAPPPHEPLHDPAEARSLLEAAGWTDADDDGIRERDGEPLSFELRVPAGNDRRADAAEIIQEQLARVGVRVTIASEEFNALLARLMGGDYEAALMGWQVALDPDISAFWNDPAHPLNVVAFADSAASEAIARALAAPSAGLAAGHWRAAGAAVAAAYPYAFLWYFDVPLALGPRLEGVEPGPTGWG
ncbi:MAG: ABC transporter substrate-binding protein, partial [Gemmatimonadota bacterium]|nr:ABC transporter substrate-binding protein [Gemmatimonadota bacterium]